MTFALVALLTVIFVNLFVLALCRAAHDADEAIDRLYVEPGTGMFDR